MIATTGEACNHWELGQCSAQDQLQRRSPATSYDYIDADTDLDADRQRSQVETGLKAAKERARIGAKALATTKGGKGGGKDAGRIRQR